MRYYDYHKLKYISFHIIQKNGQVCEIKKGLVTTILNYLGEAHWSHHNVHPYICSSINRIFNTVSIKYT